MTRSPGTVVLVIALAAACSSRATPARKPAPSPAVRPAPSLTVSRLGPSHPAPLGAASGSATLSNVAGDPERAVRSASRVGATLVFALVSDGKDAGLVRSADGGRSWVLTGPSRFAGDEGGMTVAFADAHRGWLLRRAFNRGRSALSVTSDGGRRWTRVDIARGTALATHDGYAYLIAGDELYVAPPGTTRLRPLVHTTADTLGTATAGVLAYPAVPKLRSRLEFDLIRGASVSRQHLPCGPEPFAQAVAALSERTFVAVCGSEPGAGEQLKRGFVSTDGARTWQRVADPGVAGYIGLATGTGARVCFAGGRMNVECSSDGGRSWRPAALPSGGDGFAEVAFADARHGWAVAVGWGFPLYLTEDGGRTWRRSAPSVS